MTQNQRVTLQPYEVFNSPCALQRLFQRAGNLGSSTGGEIKQADGSILYEFEYEGHRLEQRNTTTRYGNQTAGSEFMQG